VNWAAPNDPLGAFCRENHIAVKGSRRGPLAGLAFAAKDAFEIAGARTGFGQPDWLRTHEPATDTADAVKRVLAAGADMTGKTHCDELCYSLTGENVHFGTPVNVNAPGLVPGGSSNGSAAAVAGGLVDAALGTDTGGSVRVPECFCGLFGIRPSHDRISLAGVVGQAPSFDTIGWFARDGDLIARGTNGVDAALIFFLQSAAQGVCPLPLHKYGEFLDFFIGGVLGDSKIKLHGFSANASPCTDGDAGVSFRRSFVLGDAEKRGAYE